jgi:hypothetical protein
MGDRVATIRLLQDSHDQRLTEALGKDYAYSSQFAALVARVQDGENLETALARLSVSPVSESAPGGSNQNLIT